MFRGVGRPGVVLVGEGPAPRIGKLLEAERKRTARVVCRRADHAASRSATARARCRCASSPARCRSCKPKLTKQEVAEVSKRLTALGGVKLPVPKGVDPMPRPPRPQGHARRDRMHRYG